MTDLGEKIDAAFLDGYQEGLITARDYAASVLRMGIFHEDRDVGVLLIWSELDRKTGGSGIWRDQKA